MTKKTGGRLRPAQVLNGGAGGAMVGAGVELLQGNFVIIAVYLIAIAFFGGALACCGMLPISSTQPRC